MGGWRTQLLLLRLRPDGQVESSLEAFAFRPVSWIAITGFFDPVPCVTEASETADDVLRDARIMQLSGKRPAAVPSVWLAR